MTLRLACLLALVATAACTGNPTQPPLRSLRGMSDSALLCLAQPEEELQPGEIPERIGRPLANCPDFNSDDGEERGLHALVTQPETGEVALIDLQGGLVVDTEVALPGISFLPVGQDPISIVSTPGGQASFVATREAGRPGLFALPTSCVGPRRDDQPFVDVTSWPACRLPAAPGSMQLLIDPQGRESCDAAAGTGLIAGVSASAQRSDCPADLAVETTPSGRRKLLVALPASGELVVIDAQELLNRTPGSFDDCTIERSFSLQVALPDPPLSSALPSDLPPRDAMCAPAQLDPTVGSATAHPYDFAWANERLYVADLAAPVVHVLDTHDPCALSELPALLPQSYTHPDALITTRRVAVSPLTSKGERFVYAVEESSVSTAGSVMVFDVSEGSAQRTPLMREGALRIQQEPPDRIQFAQEAADVEFVQRQVPAFDPATGVSMQQVSCDPLETDADEPGAQYQPNSDLNAGAGPSRLRGTFAMVALHSGQVAVVDVDDLDAPCRRPTSVNPGVDADFRGCSGDPNVNFAALQTVSGELSCRVIEPHRARSSTYFLNDARRGRVAALRQFPRLSSQSGRSLPTDQSEEGKKYPMLLAADFLSGEPAQVFVGATLYENDANADSPLLIDPGRAENSSLALSLDEPRRFYPNEQFTLTYEGELGSAVTSTIETEGSRALLDDGSGGRFCSRGVQDVDAARAFAAQFFPQGASDAELDEFVATHADYIQLHGDFPREDSDYWQSSAGRTCGAQLPPVADEVTPLTGRRFCELWFGNDEAPTPRRDLRVQQAYQDRLWVEPRFGGESPEVLMDLVGCCFPEITGYTVRAGQQWVLRGSSTGFAHSIAVDPASGRCVPSCDPARAERNGRVLEISCADDCPLAEDGRPLIGLASQDTDLGRDQACIVADPSGGVAASDAGGECIFQQGAARFALYRGREPSVRDMRFTWQLRGGFVPLTVALSRGSNSLPEKLSFVPQLGSLLVVDGGTAGLGYINLTTLSNRPIN